MADKQTFFKDDHGRTIRVDTNEKGELVAYLIVPVEHGSQQMLAVPLPQTSPVEVDATSDEMLADLQHQTRYCSQHADYIPNPELR